MLSEDAAIRRRAHIASDRRTADRRIAEGFAAAGRVNAACRAGTC